MVFFPPKKENIKELSILATLLLEYVKNTEVMELEVNYFLELDIWAIENNITRLELSVICSNTIAKHLYEKNGFKVEGIKKNAMIIDGKYVDEFYGKNI